MSTSMSARERPLVAALALLVMAAALLMTTGQPGSADGDVLLAAAASLWRTGEPTVNAVALSDALFPVDSARMGAPGADGALYSKKGLTPSLLLLSLVAAADVAPWLSTRAAAALFNPLVNMLTALALYATVRRLGFGAWTAFWTGLLFGTATLALAYARTLYGEPLAGLLLALAVWALVALGQGAGWWLAALLGAALGLLVGVNTIYVVMAGVLALAGLALVLRARYWRAAAALLAPLALAGALLLVYNALRFGSPFTTGYRFADGEGFTFPFLTGMYGQFLSPYRGIVWYSPLLMLALPGALLLARRGRRRLALGLAGLVLLQGALFAAWWSWDGGIVWGPRFLVPALPAAMLLIAPVLALAGRRRSVFAGVAALALLSAGAALLGGLYSEIPHVTYLIRTVWGGDVVNSRAVGLGAALTDPMLSPLLGHLALAQGGWPMMAGWAQSWASPVLWLAPLALGFVGLVLLAARGLARRVLGLGAVAALLALNGVAGGLSAAPDAQQAQAVQAALDPPAALFAQTGVLGTALLDVEVRAPVTVVNAPTAPDDRDARPLWDWQHAQAQPFWLMTWFGPADPQDWAAQQAWQTLAFARETTAAGHRLLLFAPSAQGEVLQMAWDFDGITLDSVETEPRSTGLAVTLRWRALGPPPQPRSWFVHALDADGAIVAQQDRAPQGGYAPVERWEQGEVVIDRLLLLMPDARQARALRIGWLQADGARVPVTGADGQPAADGYIVIALPGGAG